MISEDFECELVSWDEAYRLSKELAARIKSAQFRPDLIIAVGRGGYVPARIVADFMLHSLLSSMKIEHWGIAASKRDETTVRFPLSADVRNKSVLILDDITDTGDTLRVAVDYVKDLGSGEVRTGVLQHKVASSFEPDYYAEKIVKWRWVIYPWAAHEDLVGFTERVLSVRPKSSKEIRTDLHRRFKLDIDEEQFDEIIWDLVALGGAEQVGDGYRVGR